MSKPWTVIVTCEHASRALPPEWESYFQPALTLEEHRWWDPGAKQIATGLASELLCPVFLGHYSRLLIDLNRTPENPQRWSEISGQFSPEQQKTIEEACYWPYWKRLHQTVAHKLTAGHRVLHLSIHSFTPVFEGVERTVDFGLLLDPSRELESRFCTSWSGLLSDCFPGMAIATNEPYRGTDDGLTTFLRQRFLASDYSGVEFELNFKHFYAPQWSTLLPKIIEATVATCRKWTSVE